MFNLQFNEITRESLEAALPLLLLLLAFNGAATLMALLYAFYARQPHIFQKGSDGRLPFFSWVVFWPYFFYNYAQLLAWRFLSREPAFAEVEPGLYWGRRLCRDERHRIEAMEPLAVLDLTAEFAEPEFMREQGEYLRLPILDMTPPRPRDFERALAFIRDHRKRQNIYVHCALGHGRAAAILAAYLVQEGRCATVEEAEAWLRGRRHGVRLTRAQRKAVKRYLEGKRAAPSA
ncbi:MAG: dual specificity protein phosphatase family protein [Verrucomicrobiae bacterium]|nr:dual specificity protein phosphatase family protein [Verrucomicrobiae bacterium]